MSTEVLQKLLDDYVMGSITPGDRQRLLSLLRDKAFSEEVKALLLQDLDTGRFDSENNPEIRERLNKNLAALVNNTETTKTVHRIHFLKTAWFRYAAAILLFVGIGAYLYFNQVDEKGVVQNVNPHPVNTEVAPGGNKAVLTLADGTTITLDSMANGDIARQGNSSVVKLSDGRVMYNRTGNFLGDVMINTMTTPKGGQYQLTLPDGSKVWLNAASSITYPADFVGNERRVKVAGEAYFEVTKNKQKPFIVDIDGKSLVKVLGTSFNINSYADESSIKTTLLEGSVKVINNSTAADALVASSSTNKFDRQPKSSGTDDKLKGAVILKPGQEALINTTAIAASSDRQPKDVAGIVVNPNADIEKALAWKNGLFNFNGADLYAVMRQLERWYDIKVRYEGSVSNITFKGEMYRNVNLSKVLENLQEMGVKFRMDGKTLIVL